MIHRVPKSLARQVALTLAEVLVVIFVVAVLAVLLVPVLWNPPSREHARRASCMSNLNQFSKALEAYCGDYDGYFPCYPGWGQDPSLVNAGDVIYSARIGRTQYSCAMTNLIGGGCVRTDEPLSLPQFGRTPVGNGCGQAFPGVNFFRTVFFGSPIGSQASLKAGNACFAGPVGLGNLVACGYIKDARVLMCPSASGMPWDAGARFAGLTRADFATLIGTTGFEDATALCGGDYPTMLADMKGTGWQGVSNVYGFQSSYNYRGVPISTAGGGKPSPITSADFSDTTNPGLIAEPGCPQFKTQRMLINRAIVSDSFSKWDDASVPTAQKTGYGIYAHKDAYMVLYGDWHVRVTGDPDKKIMSWSQSLNAGTPLDQADISASIATIAYATAPGENPHSSYAALPAQGITPSEGFLIWHFFDNQEGIDNPAPKASPSGASSTSGK